MMAYEALAEEYVRLGAGIERHLPGYIDAYYGPPEWRDEAGEPPALPDLAVRAAHLVEAVAQAGQTGMDEQRRDYLDRHVRAVQTTLRLLQGEKLSLADEVEALYDVRPERTPEAVFEEAHRVLDELLPAGESLPERMIAHRRELEAPVDQVRELLPLIHAELRQRTRQRFDLPDDEAVEYSFVKDQPWSAYNHYLGGCRSGIEINTDLPLRINSLADFIAHEGYPGHHTEGCLKEQRLVEQEGRFEHSIALINTPSCVIAEGIATTALRLVMSDEEWVDWHRQEIFPRAGKAYLDPAREQQIDQALRKMAGLSGNAAFLLHDDGQTQQQVQSYLQHYGLLTEAEVKKSLQFLGHPLYRSYIFTYFVGRRLLEDLFTRTGQPERWFGRLLAEAVTPSQVRGWIELA